MNETTAALLGVMLGGTFSLIGQWVNNTRASRLARDESIREARASAIADFAKALMEYRMTGLQRSLAPLQANSDLVQVASDHRRARAAAWHAYYRVQLLEADSAVAAGAKTLIEEVGALKSAPTPEDVDRQADAIRDRLNVLVTMAADSLTGSTNRRGR